MSVRISEWDYEKPPIIYRSLNFPLLSNCCMCDKEGDWDDAVPYYCGPVAEGKSEGGYRTACPTCFLRWKKWNDSLKR
jgi:hypothetical protein